MSARARATWAWSAAVAAALLYVATSVRVDADFSAFLPAAATAEQRFLAAELKEGVAGRLLLVDIAGDAPERLAAVSQRLAEALAASDRFRYVNNGAAERAQRDFDALREHRYLLGDAATAGRLTTEGLRAALVERVRDLAGGSGLFEKQSIAEDPTGETLRLARRLAPAARPLQRHGVWFSADGTRALLVADTKAPGSDLDGQEKAVAALEAAFAGAREGTRAAIRHSSPGAMAARSRTLIAADAAKLGAISTALILAILGFVYRSPRIVILCAVPALTGLLLGLVAVDVAFGGVHAITLGFGATLLGEAVDYPGYLLTQKRANEPVAATLARLARTLALAVLTTAGAAVALLVAGFPGLAQLGLLTMVGVVGAGAVTALLLPHWVPAGWHPAGMAPTPAAGLPLSPTVRRTVALAALAALAAAAASGPWWDDDLANMNPLPPEFKTLDRELRAALGAPDVRHVLIIEGATQEEALVAAERARSVLARTVAANALDGFELVSDYLPSQATQRARQAALPAPAQLRARFDAAMEGLPLTAAAFEPFLAAVEHARTAPPLGARDFAGTALGLKIDGLLRTDAARWRVVVPLYGVRDAAAAASAIAASGSAAVRWIDLKAASRTMMADFRARAGAAFAFGVVLILLVLAVGLRSLRLAARVALPVAVAVVATAAATVALGSALTVFHLVALMLVAGIGTNYALFLARGATDAGVPAPVLRSLAVVGGTTLCAFGTLALSHAPVLHAIGLTVSLGVVASLAFALLLPVARSDRRGGR